MRAHSSTRLGLLIGSALSLPMVVVAPGCGREPLGGAVAAQATLREGEGFQPPAGTVAVNFIVSDEENRVYEAGDLKWKGSLLYDPATRIMIFDPTWSGAAPGAEPLSGWPVLYDDGPWTEGGHEPALSVAGDHVWGITAFVAPPADGSLSFEYGLIDALYETTLGNGWIWQGANGAFSVDAGATAPIDAPGMAFPKFGKIDVQLVLDTSQLNPVLPWDLSTATVKSSAWGWGELPLQEAGAQKLSFELAAYAGKHNLLTHTGLLNPGDRPEFVFVLGGLEYRDYAYIDGQWYFGPASSMGVNAGTKCLGTHPYGSVPIEVLDDWNTAVTVPACAHPPGS